MTDPPTEGDAVEAKLAGLVASASGGRRLGPADRERLLRVRLLLAARGVSPDAAAAAAWFGPVLCSSPLELAGFNAGFAGAMRFSVTTPPQGGGESRPADDPPNRHGIRVALLVFLVGAVAMAALLLWQRTRTIIAPVIVSIVSEVARPNLPTPGEGTLPWLAAMVLAALPLAAAIAWAIYDHYRRRRLGRSVNPNPAPARTIPVDRQAPDLFAAVARPGFAAPLRRRLEVVGTRIDGAASVRGTIAAAGMPMLKRRARLLTPEYVFALDVRSSRDHLAYLGRAVGERLRAAGLNQKRAEFFGNPGALRLDDDRTVGDRRVGIAELRGDQSPLRLMLFGEAHDCLGGDDGAAPSDLIAGDVLLDPRPRDRWDWRERALAGAGMMVMSLVRGEDDRPIGDAVGEDGGRTDLVARLDPDRGPLLADDEPSPLVVAELIGDLAAHLGDDGMRWLRALGIFPLVEPALTLLIGQHLMRWNAEPVLNEGSAIALARLPWLRVGRMPDWLRLALAHGASHDDVKTAAAAIQAYLLPDTAADGRLTIRDDKANRKALVEWMKRSSESGYADAITLDAMRGRQPNRLGVRAPGRLARALRTAREHRTQMALAAVAAAVLAGSLGTLPRVPDSAGTSSTIGGAADLAALTNEAAPTSTPLATAPTNGATGADEMVTNMTDPATGETPAATATIEPNAGATAPPRPPVDRSEEPSGSDTAEATPGPFIVFFDWDKSDITPEAAAVLDNAVAQFRSGSYLLTISGHSDTGRSRNYSLGLSQREADSVKAYLASHGVPDEAMRTQAFGSSRLRVQAADGVREIQNRRVEIVFGPR